MGDPYTIKCDVWSLGVVFYKMLYNLYPWQKTDNIMILVERMKKPFDFPPNIDVSEWLKQVLRGMLTIDEGKRWPIKQVLDVLLKESKEMDVE
jgi:serine/threonine protein kinase